MILDSDRVATEVVGQSHGGDVHFALQSNLSIGQMLGVLAAGNKLEALGLEPISHGVSFGIANLRCLVVQRRLTHPLLKDARRIEQVVGNDRVEHSHATLIEHSHDGPLLAHLSC